MHKPHLGESELRGFLFTEVQTAKRVHAQAMQDTARTKAAAEKAAAEEKQAKERLDYFEGQLAGLAPAPTPTATRGHAEHAKAKSG